MEMLTHAVYWVEIPVLNFERAKLFYSIIFDYQMPEIPMGQNRMGFLLFDRTTGIGAAIVQGTGYIPSPAGPKVYLNGGSDLNIVLARIPAAGGKIIIAKALITPEIGYMASFEDCEGNVLWLHSMQ